MADFRLTVDLDSQAVLRGFQLIETEARAAGQRAGRGLQQALATQARQGVQELTNQLARVQGQTVRVNVDASAFESAGAQVEELRRLLRELSRQPVQIPVDAQSTRQLEGAERSVSDLIAQLTRLQARQVRLSVDSAAFDRLGVRIRDLRGEITALQQQRVSVQTDPRSLEVMRARVVDLRGALEKVAVGSPAFRALKGDVAAASAELAKAERAAGQARNGFSSLVQVVAGLGVGAAVIGFFKSSISEAIQLESVTRKLSNTLGEQGAAGALSFTRKLSNDLGLSFKTLTQGFAGFTAAATAANVPMQVQRDLFGAVAKTGQALGMSNDEISGSLLALQQIASKGTVSMEELRGQLGERMPIALSATAKGLGLTVEQLIRLVESGKLSAQQFFPAITKGLNELTKASGGYETAAQKIQKLQNAWDDLQVSFGKTMLPKVTGLVDHLRESLEEISVQGRAAALGLGRGLLGVDGAGAQLVGTLTQLQEKFNVSDKDAEQLFRKAAKEAGATLDAFGRYNLTLDQSGEILERLPGLVEEWRKKHRDVNAEQRAYLEQQEAQRKKQEEQNRLKAQELGTTQQLLAAQQSLTAAQTRAAQEGAGLAIAQRDAVLSYASAAQSAEQSRFDIAKSFNQYELSKLQERGASEAILRQKRKEGEAIELAALQARIVQQQASQKIELQTLAIKQQAAREEAQSTVLQARVELQREELKLQQLILQGKTNEAEQQRLAVESARLGVSAAEGKLNALGKLQPLEAATALATQQTARNQLAAEAAAKGYGVAVDGSLRKITGTVGQFEALATITARTADEQDRFAKLAARTGLEAKKAADGTILIGKTIKDSRAGARGLAGSFTTLGNEAPGAADSTSEFSGFLQQGQNFVKGIVNLNLGGAVGKANTQAKGLATEMQSAAGAADRFYRSLREAAGLPAARWAGGPVAPGQTVRINDGPGARSLGQESFLSSSGRLSLINRPANSLWSAPSRGLVVPASVTEQLKAAGAFGPTTAIAAATPRATGGDPGTAALAVEVAKLRVEVGELKRKRWDVHVNLRQDGSGLRMQKLLNGIR